MSGLAFHHLSGKDVCQLRHSEHVELQHVEDLRKRLVNEASVEADARVVDQYVDWDPAPIKPRLQFSTRPTSRQIDSFYHDINAVVLAEVLGQSLHRLCATSRQYEVRFTLCQKLRKLNAETARCAGDQRPLAG